MDNKEHTEVPIEKVLSELQKVHTMQKIHLEDPEPHQLVTTEISGLVPNWTAANLYTDGLRYRGLGVKDIGRYSLSTMAFGRYIGWGYNFKDFPAEFEKYKNNLSVITIEGFGPIVSYPYGRNNFGGDEITDPGLFRKISILDIASGNLIYKYTGSSYNSSNNYGWISSNHWEPAEINSGIGTGSIKVRRSYDGANLDLDIRGTIENMQLKGTDGIIKIATLPKGYKINSTGSDNNIYFLGFGQKISTPEVFPVNMYINNSGSDIRVVCNRDIEKIILNLRVNSSNPFSIYN